MIRDQIKAIMTGAEIVVIVAVAAVAARAGWWFAGYLGVP